MPTKTAPKTAPISPYLTVKGAADAIAFYQKAFAAKEKSRMPAQDGKRLMHADITINGGTVLLCDEFPEYGGGGSTAPGNGAVSPVAITIQYARPAEVDATFQRAINAGAKTVQEPQDMFWDARFAMLTDPFGHRWFLNAPLPKKKPAPKKKAAAKKR
jgi:PhnB protein